MDTAFFDSINVDGNYISLSLLANQFFSFGSSVLSTKSAKSVLGRSFNVRFPLKIHRSLDRRFKRFLIRK